MPKIAGKHFIFKANIVEIRSCLLIDNGNEVELIDKFFVHTNKIGTFKLKTQIRLELNNKEVVKWLDKACLVDIQIGNHQKQLLCYVTKLDVYFVVLEDG